MKEARKGLCPKRGPRVEVYRNHEKVIDTLAARCHRPAGHMESLPDPEMLEVCGACGKKPSPPTVATSRCEHCGWTPPPTRYVPTQIHRAEYDGAVVEWSNYEEPGRHHYVVWDGRLQRVVRPARVG